MRVVLTIPDGTDRVDLWVKSGDDSTTKSTIFLCGTLTNSRFIDKEETMGMRYTEGLEKRIDELEETFNKRIQKAHDRLNQFNERFANLNSHIDAVEGTFIERTDRLEKRIEAHAKSIASTGEDVDRWYDENRRIEEQVGGLRRTVDSLDRWTDATDGQLKEIEKRLAKLDKPCIDAEAFKSLPKSTGEVDATANRGVYTDILRRLGALEKRANVARADITKIMGHKVTLEERVDKLEERAKVSRPTWDNFSLHDQRICKLESRMEDAEKKAAVAESVRKQLAADIKAIQGRINKICEETCVDA